MVQYTSPDAIAMWDNGDPTSIVQESQTQGASVQSALSKRERFDFVWANSAERTGQTGMVQGSRGYQVDTKSEYLYDNSNWRLAASYAEFNNGSFGSQQSYPNTALTGPNPITVNPTLSTDTTFVTGSPGSLTFVNPGVYALSWTIQAASFPGGSSYAAIYDAPVTTVLTLNGFTQGTSTVVLPFYRITAANTVLAPRVWNQSGAAINMYSVLRVGRIA